jgi:hypothetical protein
VDPLLKVVPRVFSTTISKAALPALVLAALTLSGCGGSAPAAAPTSEAGSAAPSAAASAPATAGSAPSASPSTATAAKGAKDPCTVLDAGQIYAATGVKVQKGKVSALQTSQVCSWLPQDEKKSNAAIFSAQEGALPGPLSQVEDQLKSQFGGTVSKLTVTGADDARYVTGKQSGLDVIDVLAQKDGLFYQVLVASPRNVAQHKAGTIKLTEALIKG